MISHINMISASAALLDRVGNKRISADGETMFSFLPAAHIYERILDIMMLMRGCSIGFYQGDPLKLVDDVQELKPSVFPGVPRVWQRVHDRIRAQVDESNFLRRFLFHRALESRVAMFKEGQFPLEPLCFVLFNGRGNRRSHQGVEFVGSSGLPQGC